MRELFSRHTEVVDCHTQAENAGQEWLGIKVLSIESGEPVDI